MNKEQKMATITPTELDCEFWAEAAFCAGDSDQGVAKTDPGPTPTGNETWNEIPPVLYPIIDGNLVSAEGVILSECEIYNECDDDFVSNCTYGLNYLSGWCLNEPLEETQALSTEQVATQPVETLPETGVDASILALVAVLAMAIGMLALRTWNYE